MKKAPIALRTRSTITGGEQSTAEGEVNPCPPIIPHHLCMIVVLLLQ